MLLALLLALAAVVRAEPDDSAAPKASLRAVVHSVEGAPTALLQRGLELREAPTGAEVRPGERVRTDAKTTVVLSYADGSKLTVLPGSDLEPEQDAKQAQAGVQGNFLRSGTVLGVVKKAEPPKQDSKFKEAPPAPKPKIRFTIRTKTAVMGVRGTEFVAAVNEATGFSQFNTLEGAVEVAKDAASLLEGEGVSVSGGSFVRVTPEGGIGEVRSFDTSEFMEAVQRGEGPAGTGAVAPPGGSSALGPAGKPSASTGAVAGPTRAASPPALAPPPKLPAPPPAPEPPPAVAQARKEEIERERPRIKLAGFAAAAFFSGTPGVPNQEGGLRKALFFSWTPTVPIGDYLMIRGSAGVVVFENGSLNNNFLVRELHAFVGLKLLKPLFIEAGLGRQAWVREERDLGMFSLGGGLILSENGFLNRLFVTASGFNADENLGQIKLGIGFQVF